MGFKDIDTWGRPLLVPLPKQDGMPPGGLDGERQELRGLVAAGRNLPRLCEQLGTPYQQYRSTHGFFAAYGGRLGTLYPRALLYTGSPCAITKPPQDCSSCLLVYRTQLRQPKTNPRVAMRPVALGAWALLPHSRPCKSKSHGGRRAHRNWRFSHTSNSKSLPNSQPKLNQPSSHFLQPLP